MNRPLALLRFVLVLCLAASVAPSAFPSGTAIPTFGNPLLGMGFTITRQIVPMENVGGRLVGRPRTGSVAAIAICAPGCPPNDIVIDEKATEGNNAFLQVVAPPCIREKFVQATMFLRRGSPRVRLEKSVGGNWLEYRLQTIPLPPLSLQDHSSSPTPAVVVNDLGLIQLLDEHAKEAAPAGLRLTWTADLRTRTGRAAWHLLWPAAVLWAFVMLSWGAHKVATLAGRG